jgi:DNA-directed RNA polymerase sigma subunit (sigma70/sigma32)
VGCIYHLAFDVTESGTLVQNHPGRELEDLEHTCALDAADQGGLSDEAVGALMNLTREAVRQIEQRALQGIRSTNAGRKLRVYTGP